LGKKGASAGGTVGPLGGLVEPAGTLVAVGVTGGMVTIGVGGVLVTSGGAEQPKRNNRTIKPMIFFITFAS
jgi:hypothetical protein